MIILHHSSYDLAKEIATLFDMRFNYYKKFSSLLNNSPAPHPDFDLEKIRKKYQLDINYYPKTFDFRKTSLFISDMDSTLISIECIDEMAKQAGVYEQVKKITMRAMQGNLDFYSALKMRLALLAGLSCKDLLYVYEKKLKFHCGVERLVKFLRVQNIRTALISGGFDFFAMRVLNTLKMDDYLANKLEIKDNKLTGKTLGLVVGGREKADFLGALCTKYRLPLNTTIAVGDGSNDLLMMKKAGLSVAYRGKKRVREIADVVIDYGCLDCLKHFFTLSLADNL